MAGETEVQTFTPEEEARYARWGLGTKSEGEKPPVTDVKEEETEEAEEIITDEADEAAEEEVEEETEDQPHKKKSGVQRLKEKNRIADEARIRAEERARIAEERLTALEAGKKPEELKTTTSKSEEGKPDPNAFNTQAEYLEARDAWLLKTFEANLEAKAAKTKAETEKQTKAQTWSEKVEAAKSRYADLVEVLNVPFATPVMQEALIDADNGVDVAYYLAKNLNEAKKIAAMGPIAAAREIGKIEARLAPPPAPKAAARTTSAPPPPTPVSARGTANIDPAKMSDAEWLAHNRAKRAGR